MIKLARRREAQPESHHPLSEKVSHARWIDGISGNYRNGIRACVTGKSPWPLVLTGETGCGKTYAGLCVVDWYGGWYSSLRHLHEQVLLVRSGSLSWPIINGAYVTYADFWDSWESAGLCVLDEIGTRLPQPAMYDTLYDAVRKREYMPLIVCANATIDALSHTIDDRVLSVLKAGTVVALKGDRRLRQ